MFRLAIRAPLRLRPAVPKSPTLHFTSSPLRHIHHISHEQPFQTKRLPFKTVVVLIAASSTAAMALYVGIEMWQFHRTNDSARTIFLPLWMNSNLLGHKTFRFPEGLQYLDEGFRVYIEEEMGQLNRSSHGDLENYHHILQHENITYAVLEQLTANMPIRKIFGLPMVVDQPSEFSMWVEATNPSFSGVQIALLRKHSDSGWKNTTIEPSWKVRPFNVASMLNDALIDAGLKLDRLDPPDLVGNDIHKVLSRFQHNDYDVMFSGQLVVMDKHHRKKGIVKYRAKLDFDHLVVNRGVKMVQMELVHENVTYKVM
ncbi:uncharacterized protein CANTADRAFT_5217 [Suhomyces tanzawaensis NRRL Y-17324]|uniref:Uncharacterized protein n=1 Tax=Suhomyces tanzawaensis NRRL Y-17324 TaxID=984487 RepID=A0A1E4SP04_9ASCO|nr:uncharacterized protein CANTADRAFT_5217 [Suhomyces tanzawaensis NRRL Y-17324]ODV81260.1 hypothetical protein CANTADRAFT_5217 [Suhomyces tanzawaensis NRRL Y-17324]